MHSIYIILIAGVIILAVVFTFIIKQNAVLMKHDKTKGFTSYNQKKETPAAIIKYWAETTERTAAVKHIVYLDYFLMIVYGCLVAYALYFFGQHQTRNWLRYFFWFGILLIIAGVVCDAIQDRAILQHLTKNTVTDFRNLTKPKFTCIIISVLILITGIIYYQKDLQ